MKDYNKMNLGEKTLFELGFWVVVGGVMLFFALQILGIIILVLRNNVWAISWFVALMIEAVVWKTFIENKLDRI